MLSPHTMSSAVKLHFDQSTADLLEAWQQDIRTRAVEIIQTTLPAKILALNKKLLEIDQDKQHVLSRTKYSDPAALQTDVTIHEPSTSGKAEEASKSKKRKTAADSAVLNGADAASTSEDSYIFPGVVVSSDYLMKAFDELRSEWEQLAEIMDVLKMYINLLIPLIEDGDTFGVSVQEEALNEIVRTQDSAYNLLSTPLNYYSTRGDLAARMIRYPGVHDYQHALREHDRKAILRLTMQVTDIRNMYAVCLDILTKNIARISKPKSGNQMGSYG